MSKKRTREEIWQSREYKGRADSSTIIELLLDIRDLLQPVYKMDEEGDITRIDLSPKEKEL